MTKGFRSHLSACAGSLPAPPLQPRKDKPNKRWGGASISIVGTEDLCYNMSQILHNELNITSNIKDTNKSDVRIRTLVIGKQYDVLNFCNWLYEDATIWLSRKKNSYDVLKQIIG